MSNSCRINIRNSEDINSDSNDIIIKKKYDWYNIFKYFFLFMCMSMICLSFIYVGIQIKNTNIPELANKLDNIKDLNSQLIILNKSLLKIDDLQSQLKLINNYFSKLDIKNFSNKINEIIKILKIFTKPIKFEGSFETSNQVNFNYHKIFSGAIMPNKP